MGDRAIVTAGASGIGHAIAQRLFADGCAVAICDVDQAVLDEASRALGLAAAIRADDFHDRYVLTDLGGIMIGAGLSADGPDE